MNMNNQTLTIGWSDKLMIAVMATLILVAGFFASLLAFSIGSAVALVIGIKLWWMKRQNEKRILDAEYTVINE